MEDTPIQDNVSNVSADSEQLTETPNTSIALEAILKNIDVALKALKLHVSEIRTLRREVLILEKSNSKNHNKKRKRKSNGNTGFVRPILISKELADFLTTELGSILETDDNETSKEESVQLSAKVSALTPDNCLIARTDVTKLINRYIKYHSLQDPEAKTFILLTSEKGKVLEKILSPVVDENGKSTGLTFINIQKYIKHHFPKTKEKEVVPKVEVVVDEIESAPVVEKESDPPVTKVVSLKKKIKKPVRRGDDE